MKRNRILWSATSIFIFSVLLTPPLIKADILIKKVKHTDEATMLGETRPAKDEEGTTWISKDKMREDMGENSTIVRYDIQKIYILNHSEKTYSEIDMPINLEEIVPAEGKQILQTIQISAKVSDAGETMTIKDWKCKKYQVEVNASLMGMNMPMTIELWTSKDLGIDQKIYNRFLKELLSLNPMTKDLVEEFEKIEGYPVRSLFSMSVMDTETKSKEEVVSVEEKDAPEETYELPEGYTLKPFNPFEQESEEDKDK